MSCVAVATSPALVGAHSPSLRHRDDPGLFADVRSSQLVSCLDMLPSSPLRYTTPKLSPYLSSCKCSPSNPSMPPPSHPSLPPPSPRVQCSPRTPSRTTPAGTPSARSVCPCGGLSMCPSGSCSVALASPSDGKRRSSTSLEKRFGLDGHSDGSKYGVGGGLNVEPPSPRSNGSPCTRYSRAMPPLHSTFEAASPRFAGTNSLFATPRAVSRPGSSPAKILPTVLIDGNDLQNSDSNTGGGTALPSSWISHAENLFRLDIPKDRGGVTQPTSTSNVNQEVAIGDLAGQCGRPSTPPLKRKRPPKLEIPLGVNVVIPNNFPHLLDLEEDALNDMTVEGSYYGIACKKGRRENLEDTQRAIPELHGDSAQAFFGVFDGHGGRKAADFAAENLVNKITAAIEDSNEEGEGLVEAAVRTGYLALDAEFLEKRVSSGASCVTALIKDGCLVVANAGDCRAVLSRAGTAEALTSDHRAGREDERLRIENLGGFVDNLTGTWRVQGVLAVSRGIGDLHLKEWISAEPEVQTLRITSDCEFLILASDGLWDAVTNQEAVDIAKALLQSERVDADVMESQIPLAMASSSLSKGVDDRSTNARGQGIGREGVEAKTPDRRPEDASFVQDESVPSVDDDDAVDLCVGTFDPEMPDVGFSEPPLPNAGPAAACKRLVEESVKRGCHDDISVLIVDLHHFQRK